MTILPATVVSRAWQALMGDKVDVIEREKKALALSLSTLDVEMGSGRCVTGMTGHFVSSPSRSLAISGYRIDGPALLCLCQAVNGVQLTVEQRH